MKKGKLFVVIISFCITLSLALPFMATAAQPKLIKIGGTLPLTGPGAENAQLIKRGYEY